MSQITEAGLAHTPYASPVHATGPLPTAPSDLELASSGQRLGTFLIDYIGVTLCAGVAGFFVGLAGVTSLGVSGLVGILAMIGYYVAFEAAFGRTPGKMIAGTHVVTLSGGAPTFKQCLGRTLARMVPFEPFSFLGSNAVGWHDRWTDTRVIRSR